MSAGVVYKAIPDWPDYHAGLDGTIYSSKNWRNVPFRRPKTGHDKDGYLTVQLSLGPGSGGRQRVKRVHRLIAATYLPAKPSEKHEIRHLDGDKLNNKPSNLAWGTPLENAQDRRGDPNEYS